MSFCERCLDVLPAAPKRQRPRTAVEADLRSQTAADKQLLRNAIVDEMVVDRILSQPDWALLLGVTVPGDENDV